METIIAFCDTSAQHNYMQVEASRAFQVPLAINTHKYFTHQKENTNKQTQIVPGYESDQVLNIMRLYPSHLPGGLAVLVHMNKNIKVKWKGNFPENPFGNCGQLPPEVVLFFRSERNCMFNLLNWSNNELSYKLQVIIFKFTFSISAKFNM